MSIPSRLFAQFIVTGRKLTQCTRITLVFLLASLLGSCGGAGTAGAGLCSFVISNVPQALTAADVDKIVAQGVEAASKLGSKATFAVVDRSGNVLAVHKMTGAAGTVRIGTLVGQPAQGLNGLNGIVGSDLSAVSKAITGAYLSSSGNAFSTRTASFIIQNHYAPGIFQTAAGPLFGVQFSQLPCGDLVGRGEGVGAGPKRSPLGLSADPGGFPLYKGGRVVGGIGVLADGVYGLDLDPLHPRGDVDELIAQSALQGFAAPDCIRADRITAGGLTLPYSISDSQIVAVSAVSLGNPIVANLGSLTAVPGYYDGLSIQAGSAFGSPASGVMPDNAALQSSGAYVLVDSAHPANRFPSTSSVAPVAIGQGGNGMSAAEVQEILSQALGVARQTRAQIRSPQGSAAEVSVAVVDFGGTVLGVARTSDAPLFGTDVSLQKARTALFFSSTQSAAALVAQPPISYLGGATFAAGTPFTLDDQYLSGQPSAAKNFFSNANAFADGTAFSARAIGNIARPNYPDGIDLNARGPFSKSLASWSVFNDGLQLDLIYLGFTQAIVDSANSNSNCTGTSGADGIAGLKNGIQIFPGGFPVYRGTQLIGGIGVSGDGVDQDDMISFLGLYRAGIALHSGIAHAPVARRSDTLSPQGLGLRYVQCPQSPFNNSDAQNVCNGL